MINPIPFLLKAIPKFGSWNSSIISFEIGFPSFSIEIEVTPFLTLEEILICLGLPWLKIGRFRIPNYI